MKASLTCRASFAALVGTLLTLHGISNAQVVTYDVDLDPTPFTLYTDPYNGNQIKVGGFSGIYPVPGKPDCFHVITDRGPAPDFVNAGRRDASRPLPSRNSVRTFSGGVEVQ